ncbi:discoidin domain-containing protein [Nonomuraea sp. NPDC050556]|uniref:discoidin domain-containing protein n=1 Tax=Nonomuraea sp. NPDC050556 TaxID=3364369 RepID=UPI0037A03F29
MKRLVAIAVLFLPFLLVQPAQAAALTVWTQDSADHSFASSTKPAGAPASVALYAARNEYQAAQILVRSSSAQTGVSVDVGPLTGPGAALSEVTVRREYNHLNIDQTDGWTAPALWKDVELPPDGGNDYHDALIENTPQSPAANTTLAYFYQVHVPTGQTPGVYTGSAVVRSGSGDVTVPVSVTVYNVTIPPANQSAFQINNWFTSMGWDYTGTEMSIPVQYGVTPYDANWWKVIKSFAVNMAKHRNNVIYADFQALLIPGTTVSSTGVFTWDWSNFDRFVQTFIDTGALQYIYTPTLLEPDTWDATAMQLEMLVPANGTSGPVKRILAATDTAQSNAYLDKVFPALKAHLDAKGWTDKFFMSAVDEPHTPAVGPAANWFYDKYGAYFPNPRTSEAHMVTYPATEAKLSTLTPLTSTYESNVAHYQTQRLAGKDLWLYTANGPTDHFMTRMISYPLNGPRLLPWLVWKAGGNGYLHWGWNYWGKLGNGTDFGNINTFDYQQSGDGFLVRPNKAAYDVYDSLRSEAQLDGQQDFELLTLLSRTKPLAARQITESLITNAYTYDHSGADVTQRHKQILDELVSTVPDPATPFNDGFNGTDQAYRHTQGTWSVSSGEYVQSDSSNWGFASAVEGRTYGDVAASVDLRITGVRDGDASNWAGLMIHSLNPTDMGSGYLVAQRNDGRVFLYRNGTTLAQAPVPGYVPGAWTHLRVTYVQGAIKVWSGGTQVLSVTDNAFPLGSAAVVTGGASARFDNVHLNPLVNAAEAGTLTASSSYQADGWSTQAANDGMRTSWSNAVGWSSNNTITANHTEWLKLDLGSSRPLSRVDLYPRNDGASTGLGFPIDFTVQVSADGSTWTTVASPTGYARPSADPQTFGFAPVNARYVKVTGTNLRPDSFGHYHMQFAEIETVGGDQALGRTVTSSSSVEYPAESWLRSNATDGVRLSQLWYSMGFSSALASSQHTEWVQVDLGGPSRVGKVVLWPRSDGASTGQGFPVDFTIQVSPDGTNWTTVTSRTGYPRPGATGQEFAFSPVTARYVRTTGTQLDSTYLMQFAEIEVF